MKILVLGASGQLGRCIEHAPRALPTTYHFVTRETLDLSDTSAIEQFATREGIEVIITVRPTPLSTVPKTSPSRRTKSTTLP